MTDKINDKEFFSQNWTDADGNPDGGVSHGLGFTIHWQRGAIPGLLKANQNGAFMITVLLACLKQMKYYQSSKFASDENVAAIEHIEGAINALESRKHRRSTEGVLGTHQK